MINFIGYDQNKRVYLTNSRPDAISFRILMDGEVKKTEHGNFLIYV